MVFGAGVSLGEEADKAVGGTAPRKGQVGEGEGFGPVGGTCRSPGQNPRPSSKTRSYTWIEFNLSIEKIMMSETKVPACPPPSLENKEIGSEKKRECIGNASEELFHMPYN